MQNLLNKAIELHTSNKLNEAEEIYESILAIDENNVDALHLLGLLYHGQNKDEKAIDFIYRAISIAPEEETFHLNLSKILIKSRKFELAVRHLNNVLSFNSENIDAQFQLGIACQNLKEFGKAIKAYEKVLLSEPNHLDSLNNLAAVNGMLGNIEGSIIYLNKLLNLHPNNCLGHNNLGNLYKEIGDLNNSAKSFLKAIKLDPDFITAKLNLANVQRELKLFDEANCYYISVLDKIALENQKDEINRQYSPNDNANEIQFIYDKAIIGLSVSSLSLCEWRLLNKYRNEIIDVAYRSLKNDLPPVIEPLAAILLKLEPNLIKELSIKYSTFFKNQIKNHNSIIYKSKNQNSNKIKIGYISPDFGDHPVGLLINNLFSYHDKSKFEIVGFSLKEHDDEISKNIKSSFDKYHILERVSDADAIDIIVNEKIDILVDLAGYTSNARTTIIAAKAARVQVLWLGYSSSLWMDEVEYFITTTTQVPELKKNQFKEKMIYLPDTYVCIDPSKLNINKNNLHTRNYYGLPSMSFVYASFCNPNRIDEEVFDCWMKILKQTYDSVLWLNDPNKNAKDNLIKAALSYNIDSKRIIFRKPDNLSNEFPHRLADLYLDNFVISNCTPGVLSAFVDLPVLTLAGDTSSTRAGASIVKASKLDDLIVNSKAEYIEKAIFLQKNTKKLDALKQKLKDNKDNNPLFAPNKFIKELEQSFIDLLDNSIISVIN